MNLIKSKQRVTDHGEVFTPDWLVDGMLDLVKDETERLDSRFLEPACGSGNFLIKILKRKLATVEIKYSKSEFDRNHYAILSLMCIYGIELLEDNISECKENLLEIFKAYLKIDVEDVMYSCADFILSQNIVHGDALTMKDISGVPIAFAEWGYLGKGKFQRRDFIGLSPNEANPEKAVEELVSFLPVLAYDGANMTQIDAGGVLDIAMAGTSATLLARKWESALLVNVDNETLRRVLDNPEAMAAVERIEGWRALGDNIIETIINKSDKIKEIKEKGQKGELSAKEKKELSEEEKEYKSKRKLVQEKLIKFATRIPAFMYLTDFRENTLQDVITKLEPDLFLIVTGLTVKDFHLLVQLRVFNTEHMNQAVFAFRRYEDASLRYTGIDSHEGLSQYGLFNTVVAIEK